MMHGAGACPYGGYYFIIILDECNQAPWGLVLVVDN